MLARAQKRKILTQAYAVLVLGAFFMIVLAVNKPFDAGSEGITGRAAQDLTLDLFDERSADTPLEPEIDQLPVPFEERDTAAELETGQDQDDEPGFFSKLWDTLSSFASVTGNVVDEPHSEAVSEQATTAESGIIKHAFRQGQQWSVTTLADRSGVLGDLSLTAAEDLQAVRVTITSPQGVFAPGEFVYGDLLSGDEREETISLDFNDDLLGLDSDLILRFTVFYDLAGELGESTFSLDIPLLSSRVAEDLPAGYARFVPRNDPVLDAFVTAHLGAVRASATLESQRLVSRWLFQTFKTLDLTSTGQAEVRFPAEVMTTGEASREDRAILYAALLHHAGLRAALVEVEDALYPAYMDSREYVVPVDLDASSFEDALTRGIAAMQAGEYEIVVIDEAWDQYPSAPYEGETLTGLPAISRQVGGCVVEGVGDGLWSATVRVRISNSGASAGVGCVGMVSLASGHRTGELFSCYDVEAGGRVEDALSSMLVGQDISCDEI